MEGRKQRKISGITLIFQILQKRMTEWACPMANGLSEGRLIKNDTAYNM